MVTDTHTHSLRAVHVGTKDTYGYCLVHANATDTYILVVPPVKTCC